MTTTIPSRTDARARIAACTTLDTLCDTLTTLEEEIAEAKRAAAAITRGGDWAWPELTLAERREIEDLRLSDLVDLTDLPLFGGEAPEATDGVYSWDAEQVLVYVSGTTDDGWYVEPRTESDGD